MIDQVVINNALLTDALLSGAKEVFATMIFMELEECSEPEQKIEGDTLLGSITFKGNIEGCLSICCGMPCAKTIATNMLGLEPDEEISQDDINDAIGEVANMVMGIVKARIQDSVGGLQVSIPTVVSGRRRENSLGDGTSKISMKINIEDEYIAELSLLYRQSSD